VEQDDGEPEPEKEQKIGAAPKRRCLGRFLLFHPSAPCGRAFRLERQVDALRISKKPMATNATRQKFA
jgi:hypothetical protein